MEILESAAYIALGFIPTLGLLEIAYRTEMKLRRKRGIEGRVILTTTKSLLPIVFRKQKMDKASVSIRKYFSKRHYHEYLHIL
jgi:hypothetical protein